MRADITPDKISWAYYYPSWFNRNGDGCAVIEYKLTTGGVWTDSVINTDAVPWRLGVVLQLTPAEAVSIITANVKEGRND